MSISPQIRRITYKVSTTLSEEDKREVTCFSGVMNKIIIPRGEEVEVEFREHDMVTIAAGIGTANCSPYAFTAKTKTPPTQPPWLSVKPVKQGTYEVQEVLVTEEAIREEAVTEAKFENNTSTTYDFEAAADALVEESRQEDQQEKK